MPPSADHVKIVEREENGQKVVEMPIQFIRGNFNNADLPKMLLNVSKNYYFVYQILITVFTPQNFQSGILKWKVMIDLTFLMRLLCMFLNFF